MKILHLIILVFLLVALIGNDANAQKVSQKSLQQQLNELQKQISLLQRKQELAEEISVNNADKFAAVELNNTGLSVTSPDKKYRVKLRGYIQADSRNFVDAQNREIDQFLLRSVRPTIEVRFSQNFSTLTTLDFGNGSSRLLDGYGDWKLAEYFNLRFGKFRAPVGLESWQGETETLLIERGLTSNLVSNRDIGISVYGEAISQVLEYQLAITNGAVDLANSNGDNQSGKELSARVFIQPFKNSDFIDLRSIGFGLAGSVGKRNGNDITPDLAAGYNSTTQNIFFTYLPRAFAKGQSTRINPQFWYYNNQFSMVGEYVVTQNKLFKDGESKKLTNDAWTAIFGYVLTGENAAFDNFRPKVNFNWPARRWGAFEIALRLSQLNIDRNTFPNFSDSSVSARSATEKVLGLNWYLNQNVKISINFSNNNFKGGALNHQDRKDENAFLTRLQFKF